MQKVFFETKLLLCKKRFLYNMGEADFSVGKLRQKTQNMINVQRK